MPAEIDIPEELSEKILAYVEREAGRDAELSSEDEAMVRELLATDPAAQALADDFRDVDTGLKGMFQAFGNVSVSDELMQRIHAQDRAVDVKEQEAATDKVVAFPETPKSTTMQSYAPLATAASLALAIAGGGFLYQFEARKDLEQTVADLHVERSTQQGHIENLEAEASGLQDRIAAAVDARQNAETAFSVAAGDIARLQSELATIRAARDDADTTLASTNETLADLRETEAKLVRQVTALEEEVQQVAVQGATERNALQSQLATVEADLVTVIESRRAAEAEVAEANRTIGELIGEGATLNLKVTELETETKTLAADLAARELKLETSQTALARAEQRAAELVTEQASLAAVIGRSDQELATIRSTLAALDDEATELRRARDTLATAVDQSEDDLASARAQLTSTQQQNAAFQTALETIRAQTGWLAQVAGYHVGYAGKPREVEVTAAEQQDSQALTKWLSNELGGEITVPLNLPMQGGLTFVGGRVLYTTDGQPIGQIAYHDNEGRLTAFCIKRNPTGADQDVKQAQFFGRLQMIHWQDETFQYAVVGFEDFETLEPVATWLESNYGKDT